MGISSVGSFPVWSGGSLIIFRLFRCRNLALNRFLLLFLEQACFYTWQVSGWPLCSYALICLYAPIHLYAPWGSDTPICPPYSCASVCSQRLLHVVEGCRGPLHVGHLPYMLDTSPCMGGASPYVTPPTHWLDFLMYLYVLGISTCDMGNIPLILEVWGHQHHWVSICFILYLLVVCYVSHIYYSYDYYSSGYSGVICFISDHGFFPDGASCNIGSA